MGGKKKTRPPKIAKRATPQSFFGGGGGGGFFCFSVFKKKRPKGDGPLHLLTRGISLNTNFHSKRKKPCWQPSPKTSFINHFFSPQPNKSPLPTVKKKNPKKKWFRPAPNFPLGPAQSGKKTPNRGFFFPFSHRCFFENLQTRERQKKPLPKFTNFVSFSKQPCGFRREGAKKKAPPPFNPHGGPAPPIPVWANFPLGFPPPPAINGPPQPKKKTVKRPKGKKQRIKNPRKKKLPPKSIFSNRAPLFPFFGLKSAFFWVWVLPLGIRAKKRLSKPPPKSTAKTKILGGNSRGPGSPPKTKKNAPAPPPFPF